MFDVDIFVVHIILWELNSVVVAVAVLFIFGGRMPARASVNMFWSLIKFIVSRHVITSGINYSSLCICHCVRVLCILVTALPPLQALFILFPQRSLLIKWRTHIDRIIIINGLVGRWNFWACMTSHSRSIEQFLESWLNNNHPNHMRQCLAILTEHYFLCFVSFSVRFCFFISFFTWKSWTRKCQFICTDLSYF